MWNAAKRGDVDLLRELLRRDPDLSPLASDECGRSLLYYAAGFGQLEMIQFLLEQGATHAPRVNGITPLSTAAASGAVEAMELLLENGATHDPDDSGYTPLNTAAYYGHIDAVEVLLRHRFRQCALCSTYITKFMT